MKRADVVVKRAKGTARKPPYRDPSLPAAKRVKDLLSRMTLEEKAAQMMCVWRRKAETLVDAEGNFDLRKAKEAFRHGHGIGQVGRPSDAGKGKDARGMAELTNAIQRFFIENSRLGIPVIFHEECLHGHAAIDATSFSQPIGLGATFDPELVESLFTMTALEARVRGTHQALTPVVDVAREPRWGRVEETYGEDPYLVSRMGIAAVRGLQGDRGFHDKTRVMATLKHGPEPAICISGQVLRGLKKPHDCPAFGRECTPQSPLGATMVSAEGACAAYYNYDGIWWCCRPRQGVPDVNFIHFLESAACDLPRPQASACPPPP
jgi:Glycosyl hydrolase family 3 N terminal domain/Hydrogenase formation hypA family